MTPAALRAERLGVRLGDRRILDDVAFELPIGGFLAVVGPNGAGKTTLIRAVAGLVPLSSGAASVQGLDVSSAPRRELARRLSYVPQGHLDDARFRVRDFVEMGRYPHLRPWTDLTAADRQEVARALELTATTGLARRRVDELSGGERQRVMIAAALAQGGSLLVLDEPTTFLDYRHQTEVVRLLARLNREQRVSVVAVTHDLNGVVPAASQVLALGEGRVVFAGSATDLLTADRLREIFGCAFRMVAGEDGDLPLVVPDRRWS